MAQNYLKLYAGLARARRLPTLAAKAVGTEILRGIRNKTVISAVGKASGGIV